MNRLRSIKLALAPLCLAAVLLAPAVAQGAEGDLDTSFAGDGKTTTPFGVETTVGAAVAVDSHNRTVVAGHTRNSSGESQMILARYDVDGSLDTSFGGDGRVESGSLFATSGQASAVAIDSEDRIVVGGDNQDVGYQFALARFEEDGSLDTGFGEGGAVTTQIGGPSSTAEGNLAKDLLIDAEGRIVVAGHGNESTPTEYQFVVARYTDDGDLDTSFGDGGIVTTDLAPGDDFAKSVALDSRGRIVVAGETEDELALVRYLPEEYCGLSAGSRDPSFGGDGRVTSGARGFTTAHDVAIDSHDRPVVVGTGEGDFAAARFSESGDPDASFGEGGVSILGGFGFEAKSVVIDGAGRIVLAGVETVPFEFAVARLDTNGALDPSFGDEGGTMTAFSDNAFAAGAAIDGAGRIVVGGYMNPATGDNELAVARYEASSPTSPWTVTDQGGECGSESEGGSEERPTDGDDPGGGEADPETDPPPEPRSIALIGAQGRVVGRVAVLRTRCFGRVRCRAAGRLVGLRVVRRVVGRGERRRVIRRVRKVPLGVTRFVAQPGDTRAFRVRLNRRGAFLVRRGGRRGLKAVMVGPGLKNRALTLRAVPRRQGNARRGGGDRAGARS